KERCADKNNKSYGRKGVKVCEEWLNDYKKFEDWALNNGYSDDLTIDRIDTNGDYKPSNCRWITIGEQQANKSKNILITYCGETRPAHQWEVILGVTRGRIRDRLARG